jgi:hypothetical protein
MDASRLYTILGFIFIGIVSRLIPHPPNFTSLTALALFSSLCLNNRLLSFVTVLVTLFLSDQVLGFHSTMPFVYLSFGLIILIGHQFKEKTVISRLPFVCLFSSLLFFFLTNFGFWMTGALYPKTLAGLGTCYLAALPFFMNQIFGDFIYNGVFFIYFYFLNNYALNKKYS